jgi:histidinol phosphatase-like PHP family hydrolase
VYDLHIHSIYSDGTAGIEEISKYAQRKGLKIIAITDHCSHEPWGSKLLDLETVMERKSIIESANSGNLIVLNGLETDILWNGRIVFPKGLKKDFFDVIIGSFHMWGNISKWEKSLLSVIRSGMVDIIGHPLAYIGKIPWNIAEKIAITAADCDVALELNSHYSLPDIEFLEICREYGVKFSIGSDAHHLYAIGNVEECLEIAKNLQLKLLDPYIFCKK